MADGAKLYLRCAKERGAVVATMAVEIIPTESVMFAGDQLQPSWYAVQTCANHEKRVVEQLSQRAIEVYLPLYESIRRWKDRRVSLQLALFPGYVFVHLALRDRLRVLQTPSVVRIVGFSGRPAALPDQEIEALRQGLESKMRIEPHRYLKVGQRVRVKSGPLEGLHGTLVRKRNGTRFVISFDLIMRSVAAEIDAAELESVR